MTPVQSGGIIQRSGGNLAAAKPVYLLTGRPGTGKTSLIKEAISGMKGRAGGFYTEEIRHQGIRQGFRLVTLDGDTAVLAHVDVKSQHHVSRYGVDISSLERVGVTALLRAAANRELIVVDEIGKMELFSPRFREAVQQIIDQKKRVLGVIMLAPHPWADAIKRQPQVNIIEVTRANHPRVLEAIRMWLEQ